MRSAYRFLSLVALLLVCGAVLSQEKETKAPSPRPGPNTVEVRFADDTNAKVELQIASIEVATRYGKLTVPASEVRSIEFGLRIPDETAKRLDAAIARLGSPEFKQREEAGSELLELRELAYAAVQQAARSSDAEVARRAKDILKALIEEVPAEKLNLPRHDTVVAADFTIVGRIETATFKARTAYFGEVSLKLADLRSMRWLGNERETKLTVDAGRYGATQEAWLDTGLKLRVGAALQVSASGSVDLRPVPGEAGTMLVGPDGRSSRFDRGGGRAGGFGPAGGRAGGGPPPGRTMPRTSSPGALLGRIGENGTIFVIGSRYEGNATEEGKLYLRIAPSTAGSESAGTYDVRITTGR